MKILLVDDSAIMLKKIKQILMLFARARPNFGSLEIVTASSVIDALALVEKHRPDAVLTDFVLENGSTGLEVIVAVRAVSQRPTPAAILTQGDLSPEDNLRADRLSALVFQKPQKISEETFATQILDWLQRSCKV